MPASVAGDLTLSFSNSEQHAAAIRSDASGFDEDADADYLREILSRIIEACAMLGYAGGYWASRWCEKTGNDYMGYWDCQEDGKYQPKQAMDDLADKMIVLFEGIDAEDRDSLSEELRRLLDACLFLTNFKGGSESD